MKNKLRKILSIVLAVVMLASVSVFAFAEDDTTQLPKLGDVDLNGKVNIADARLCLRKAIRLISLEGDALLVADFDLDGNVTVQDAVKILRVSVKNFKYAEAPVIIEKGQSYEYRGIYGAFAGGAEWKVVGISDERGVAVSGEAIPVDPSSPPGTESEYVFTVTGLESGLYYVSLSLVTELAYVPDKVLDTVILAVKVL